MKYNALDVAKWLLTEAHKQGITITHMKLQKLLYYAQAYVLGMTGQPLFNNQIQAWQHGPVVPDVYHAYNKYGSNIISVVNDTPAPIELAALISTIVRDKGKLSAHDLRNITHNETAWQEAWNSPNSKVITNDMIEKCFTDMFWTSDEEDFYQPSFHSRKEEDKYFHDNISEEEKNAIRQSR